MLFNVLNWFSRVVLGLMLFFAIFVSALVYAPFSPLPDRLNPRIPLDPKASLNFLTSYKIRQAVLNKETCMDALDTLGVDYVSVNDHEESPKCHIRDQVHITKLSKARINKLKTKCETALRLSMWEYHFVQVAATENLKSEVTKLQHFGSFSCRPIRTPSGPSAKMSEHATANAVDIAGFSTAKETFDILNGWEGSNDQATFLRAVRDGACRLFRVTLSPNFNSLHADHFHFDQGRWVGCR